MNINRRTIDLRPGWCTEHSDTYHMVDDAGNCHAASPADLIRQGYTYIRHLGGWFRYLTPPQPVSCTPADEYLMELYDSRHMADVEQDW